ncbi:hypothetical protein E2P42_01230 [Candidatus Bathyarchaeota archaeon]|nr:hypothetical protein E2P42_01230 [Candidatus Bathyarchaeota archaeon]
MKIASLQKGLICVCDGKERIGEGAGFGFPVIVYPEETYFPSSAIVSLSKTSTATKVKKEFIMDRIARNKFGDVRLENQQARAIIRYLCRLYQENTHFRFPFLMFKRIMGNVGVDTGFEETKPVGRVIVTYAIYGNAVRVQVNLSQIEVKYRKKLFILNEQSANFFRKYYDSRGTDLVDKQIGAWDNVNAEWACFTDAQGQVGFRLWQVKGAILRRGRETLQDCLDWVGLDYEVNVNSDFFEYDIELLGRKPK